MIVRELIRNLCLQKSFIMEAWDFYKKQIRYNASVDTNGDIVKMQYTLLREVHTIEKGLSMKNPRKGFGQQKVINILSRLEKYYELYYLKDKLFLDYPLSVIKEYIEYTKGNGVGVEYIEARFHRLVDRLEGSSYNYVQGGIINETKAHILSECNKDLKSLLYSRHSIRYFLNKEVARDDIMKALSLAQRTPSACNRQAWKTYVYGGG